MERNFPVHAINPKQLDRFRDRLSPSGAKDDRRDAYVLAISANRHALFPAAAADRTADRPTARVCSDQRKPDQGPRPSCQSDRTAAVALLSTVPRTGKGSVEGLDQGTVGNDTGTGQGQDRTQVNDRETAREAPGATHQRRWDPGKTQNAAHHSRRRYRGGGAHQSELAFDQLAFNQHQASEINARIDQLMEQLMAAPDDESGTDWQRDVAILSSIPGVGRIVLATLLAEASGLLINRDREALRCLCGIAPVTKRSGKTINVMRRLACNGRLRNAMHHWARTAVQHDDICKAKYSTLRERGHSHARALRSVGDRLLTVACAMLRDGTLFDPNQQALQQAA